eukprot:COSAG02_NODE_39127_length_420_cov_2.688474_1_plen_92_part_10
MAGAASGAYYALLNWESPCKMSSESRGPVERAVQSGFKSLLEGVGKRFTGADVRKLCISSMEAGTLRHEDTSLACGWALLTAPLQYATAVYD